MLLLFCIPLFASAHGDPGCKDKNNKEECKKQPGVHSVEQFVFMIPCPVSTDDYDEQKAFRTAVVNYYRWYLQNESRIMSGLAQENKGKDLMPPFNISWETLHEYFEFIQKKYADWLTDIGPVPVELSSRTAESLPLKDSGNIREDSADTSPSINFTNSAK